MKIKIYAGATLTSAEVRRALPGASVAQLVTRGTLYEDAAAGVQVIGIVEGSFLGDVAISPLEIVDAMRVGVRVFGAGGLGALRAVELGHFGMVGCGRVFERIAQAPYFRDDDLGTAQTESLSMVELELSCAARVEDGRLSAAMARDLIRALRGLHFAHRSFTALADSVRTPALREAVATVRKHYRSQKRADAKSMLALIGQERRRALRANATINSR